MAFGITKGEGTCRRLALNFESFRNRHFLRPHHSPVVWRGPKKQLFGGQTTASTGKL